MKVYFANSYKEFLILLPFLSKFKEQPTIYIKEIYKPKFIKFLSFIKIQNLIKDINFTNITSKFYYDLYIDIFEIPFQKNIFNSLKSFLSIDITLPYKFKTININHKPNNKKIWISNKEISNFLQKNISEFIYPEPYLDFLNNLSISTYYNQKICLPDEYSIIFDIEGTNYLLYYNNNLPKNINPFIYYRNYPNIIKA